MKDLLAITRALYRASSAIERCKRLERIGEQFASALELARTSSPGHTRPPRGLAQGRAGYSCLGELVADGCTVATVVAAAAAKLKR